MKSFGLFRRRERNHTSMEREDFLNQIDEFKDKARHLQGMLTTKESRVQELQKIVTEREEKVHELEERAHELENLLNERQQEADSIIGQVDEQTKKIIEDIQREVNKMGDNLSANVEGSVSENMKKLDGVSTSLGDVKGSFDKISADVEELKKTLTASKKGIEDKIHNENVKCYRNIQMLVVEMNKKTVQQEQYDKDMKSLHCMVKCMTWVSIINFVVLTGFILFRLGVF